MRHRVVARQVGKSKHHLRRETGWDGGGETGHLRGKVGSNRGRSKGGT